MHYYIENNDTELWYLGDLGPACNLTELKCLTVQSDEGWETLPNEVTYGEDRPIKESPITSIIVFNIVFHLWVCLKAT